MELKQLGAEHERQLRRWLCANGDVDFGMHRQLRDYFLAPTAQFGTLVAEAEGVWTACVMFSRFGQKAYIHQYKGDYQHLEVVREWLGHPVQAFFRTDFVPDADVWNNVLNVSPGFIVDHPAYNGVFSRTVPRFDGAVYETKDWT